MLARYSPETLETHNLEIMNPESMLAAFESAGFVDVKTGNAGTASIPSSRVRSDAAGRLFGNAARAWNLGTELLPVGWPWANHVWGFGRNPS